MRTYDTSSSFLDILFNILLGFFVLLILTIILVNPPTKQGDVPLKAEIRISMEWPGKSKDDVDLIVKTPASKLPIFYGNRDIKVASLDRDDLGLRSDRIRMSDGTIHTIYENWENVAIRKLVPGEYIVNTLMFTKLDKEWTPVTIKVEKLNHPYQVIFSGTIILKETKEERTAVRFTIDKNGRLLERSQVFQSLSPSLRRYQP